MDEDKRDAAPDEPVAEAERGAAIEGGGLSRGGPAPGRHGGHSFGPTGGPAVRHRREAHVAHAGRDDRGDVFFVAVETTRMPMIVADRSPPLRAPALPGVASWTRFQSAWIGPRQEPCHPTTAGVQETR